MISAPQYLDSDAVRSLVTQGGEMMTAGLGLVSVLVAAIGVGIAVYNMLFTNHKRAIVGAVMAVAGFALAWLHTTVTHTTGGDSALSGATILSIVVAAGMGFSGMGSHNEQSSHN